MGQQYDLSAFQRDQGGVKIDFTNGEGYWRTAETSAHPEAGLRMHLKGPHLKEANGESAEGGAE